jgi:hypothetical protein
MLCPYGSITKSHFTKGDSREFETRGHTQTLREAASSLCPWLIRVG